MKERTFRTGDHITEEGKGGVGFFVIDDGTAKVSVGGQEVRTIGRGDYFGEIGLDRRHRPDGDDHRRHRSTVLRDDVVGLPAARREQRVDRVEDAADHGAAAQRSTGALALARSRGRDRSRGERASRVVAPAGIDRPDQARLPVARARHARVGARGRDRQGHSRLHPRQRHRAGSSARRQGRRGRRDRGRRERRPGGDARRGGRSVRARHRVRRDHPRHRARLRAAQRSRARRRLHRLRARFSWPACAGRSSKAST